MHHLEFATVSQAGAEPRTRHLVGWPPQFTDNKDMRYSLPPAQVVILQQDDDGGIFLTRFTPQGQEVGDTWHENVEEAKGQARFEYGDSLGDWRVVPDGVSDITAFVRQLAGD